MAAEDSSHDGFLSRWSRRKEQVRSGAAVAAEPVPTPVPVPAPVPAAVAPVEPAPAPGELPAAATRPPLPTLADVAALTHDSDYSGFVAHGVDAGVRNAALKKLFTDPHFNLMDGLDTYIGDYNTPDPLPPGMLRKMVQSKLLGLFDDEDDPAAPAAPQSPPALPIPADENPAVQLQPDDDARRPALKPGAGPDPQMQH